MEVLEKELTLKKPKTELYNIDCIEYMKSCEDNAFDLAIVDPPYGIGFSDYERGSSGLKTKERFTKNGKKDWDNNIPTDEYFYELQRVSKNQIVWGGNYFPFLWKNGCKGFIFWHKGNPVPNFSDGELAWTSFNKVAKQYDFRYYGNLQGNTSAENKIHPTQKPKQLYEWILKNYAKEGDKILDTHLGSGSSAIASYNYKFDFVGLEIDKEYFENAKKRFDNYTSQLTMF